MKNKPVVRCIYTRPDGSTMERTRNKRFALNPQNQQKYGFIVQQEIPPVKDKIQAPTPVAEPEYTSIIDTPAAQDGKISAKEMIELIETSETVAQVGSWMDQERIITENKPRKTVQAAANARIEELTNQ